MRISASEAVQRLQAGEVVAMPTDTLYGVAADFRNAAAVEALFALKGRERAKPLILLAADVHQVEPFLLFTPPDFYELAEAHWPGPLTLVLPIDQGRVPKGVRAGLLTTGFRVPDHPVALEILAKTGPLAVTSANRSGEPACTSADSVELALGDLPLVDGGPCKAGIASTIVAYEDHKWRVLRRGAITFDPGAL